jgi:flavin reductase (DIM6/NTAB) family NADH-FMN oxidoreductase RutF
MDFAAASLDTEATYKLMTGLVVPRPIAWVTTRSPEGIVNLAPFSAFTFVSNRPPMVGINVGRKAGELKDTGRNIHATGEFVVNIADDTMIEAVHLSAIEHEAHVSEVDVLGLATAPCLDVSVPRLAGAPASLECRLHRAIAFGEGGSEFLVGEVLRFHVRDGLLENGKIDTRRLRPIGRLAGPNYALLGEIVTMRPIAQASKNAKGG